MANHLTPDELSKEIGIERDEVIRICLEEHVPIYHGQDRQDAVPGAARRRSGRCPRSTETQPSELLPGRGGALARRRGLLLRRGGCFFDAAATDARSASIRSIDRRRRLRLRQLDLVAGELRLEQLAQRLAVLAAQLRRARTAPASDGDDLLRELELRLLAPRPSTTASSISAWSFTSSCDEQRLERERVAHRPDQAELLLAGEHEAAERGHAGLLHRLEQQHVRAGAAPRRRRGRGSRCGRSRSGRPPRAARSG